MTSIMDARKAARLFLLFVLLASLVHCGESPTQPSPPAPNTCSFQVAPATTNIGAAGGTVSITITTAAQCAWTASASAPWLSIVSGASGTGSGTTVVSGSANPEATSREGSVTVAEQNLRFTQAPRDVACEYATTLDSQRFGPDGGNGRIGVTAAPGCRWTATADASWVTVSPSEGTGNGEVLFTVATWSGTDERATTIRIGGRPSIIRQDRDTSACAYSVDPTELTLHWHQTSGEVRVQTTSGCPWSATSADAWLSVPTTSTSGAGTVTFSLGTHLTPTARRAPVQVRWPTATAGQNVWVTQEGCYYAIGERDKAFTKDGGKGFLLIFGTPVSQSCSIGCPWTAVSDASWIQVLGSGTGAGDDGVFYVVAANPGPGARTGRITAAGFSLVITQAF